MQNRIVTPSWKKKASGWNRSNIRVAALISLLNERYKPNRQGPNIFAESYQKKSRPRLFAGGFPVKLLGLTCGCDHFRKEGVTVKPLRKTILTTNPRRGLSILRLGLSHLTVIRTHKFTITSFPVLREMIKEKVERVNQNFCVVTEPLAVASGVETITIATTHVHSLSLTGTRSLPRAVLYRWSPPLRSGF
jgi:hypothetical protein